MKVIATLKTNLSLDTGSVGTYPKSRADLFTDQSSVALNYNNFEVAIGRLGALTSPFGDYSGYRRLRANPTACAMGDLGVGGMTINNFVVDNAIVLSTTNQEGVFGTLLYSNGDHATEDLGGDQEHNYRWTDRHHLMQGLVGYRSGPFVGGIIYSHDMPALNSRGLKKANADTVHLTASYHFGSFLLGGTAFYGRNLSSAYATQAPALGINGRDFGASEQGLTTRSLYLGIALPRKPHFFSVSAGYGRSEWKGLSTMTKTPLEGEMFRLAGVYRYHLSKSTYCYTAGAVTRGRDLLDNVSGHMLSAGVVTRF